eukprot:1194705-Prorocentrum_minimum.AAC.5
MSSCRLYRRCRRSPTTTRTRRVNHSYDRSNYDRFDYDCCRAARQALFFSCRFACLRRIYGFEGRVDPVAACPCRIDPADADAPFERVRDPLDSFPNPESGPDPDPIDDPTIGGERDRWREAQIFDPVHRHTVKFEAVLEEIRLIVEFDATLGPGAAFLPAAGSDPSPRSDGSETAPNDSVDRSRPEPTGTAGADGAPARSNGHHFVTRKLRESAGAGDSDSDVTFGHFASEGSVPLETDAAVGPEPEPESEPEAAETGVPRTRGGTGGTTIPARAEAPAPGPGPPEPRPPAEPVRRVVRVSIPIRKLAAQVRSSAPKQIQTVPKPI